MKLRKTTFLSLALMAAGLAIFLNAPPLSMQDARFVIREGESARSVASRLKRQNLIVSERYFALLARAAGGMGIKKGKYRIERGLTAPAILVKFLRGDVMTRRVTVPEGWNIYAIAERLGARGVTNPGEFLYHAANREYLESVGIYASSAEGYLFPDTYVLPEDSDPRDVIAAMHRRLRAVLSGIDMEPMKKLGLDLHELLTLASLVEKEARMPSERPYISAVFHNRLRAGMRLDCDPTVRYAVKKFSGPIGVRDLAFQSPYNTYQHRGLPPTPICSPGRDSILAALNPANTGFLYFVSRNDGSHYFSRDLRTHNRAVEFYQRGARNGFKDTQKL